MKVSSFLLGLAVAMLFAAAVSQGMSNAEEAANTAFADLSTEKFIVLGAAILALLSAIARFVERWALRVRARKNFYDTSCVADNWAEDHSGLRRVKN